MKRTCFVFVVMMTVLLVTVAPFSGCGALSNDGEEEGNVYTFAQTHNEVRNGIRLILQYDGDMNAFRGTAENMTESTIGCVRVEVHLEPRGAELGPTTRTDVPASESINVELPFTGNPDDHEGWSAHPESGCGTGGDDREEGEGEGREHRNESGNGEHS